MNLFTGAFGAMRNGLVHTEIEWADPVEAADYALLADLLMRMLDRAEQRVAAVQRTRSSRSTPMGTVISIRISTANDGLPPGG